MSKKIYLSSNDSTYYLLPGSTGEITRDGKSIDDTIFGQTFKSSDVGPTSWAVNANAIYKGYPGYVATVKKSGSPTTMTGEAMTSLTGSIYQISAAAKQIWDRTATFVITDAGVTATGQVASIDYLFGKVTFLPTYTVTGAVSVTGSYFSTTDVGNFTSYTLTQTANALNDTDIPTLRANGGFETFKSGLKTVKVDLPAVFDAADGWAAVLEAATEYIIEINPDGTGASGSLCRGFFRLQSDKQSGNVGALEEESLSFELQVPLGTQGTIESDIPFGWTHATNSPIPAAVKTALTAWAADANLFVKYLHNGTNGWKGGCVATNLSLAGGMESANTFTVSVQGSGAPVVQP